MIGKPGTRTLVTNLGRGGRWVVVQTVEMEYGPFDSRGDAEEFERTLRETPSVSCEGENNTNEGGKP
ncbi:hypothetical protein DSM104299_03190 [Baekduia alba]|uniref:hypothetical protein n=1 Tax=Baekduia alba TaxID=2997333 RepID=UPI002342646A|nr:hypothetical protein [Baekduia alba]WCB94453.1 hypothetical protein DSM104299_03190 [Baekduia alba]